MSTPTLHLKDLTIRRDETYILRDVEWKVEAGEQWVILGANGSGKTSLLNALTGILPATKGHIEVFGSIFGKSDWKALRKVIGIVNATLAEWINENEAAIEIAIGGIHNQVNYWGDIEREDFDQAMAMLQKYGLEYAFERPWSLLSQGERQRVLICRALLSGFKLLILDEPCAGLDPVARQRFLGFVDELTNAAGSPALILVTHHVEEITPGFTHVLLLKHGKVLAAGPKESVMTSENLSEAYDASLQLHEDSVGYRLELLR